MENQKQTMSDYMGALTEDAQGLMAATSDVAGNKVRDARKRLAAVLESGKEICAQVRDKAVEGAKVTDQAVREHPYQTLAIAFGMGAVIGFLAVRLRPRNED
jgi:ElaB/YqjD/DUF883 family membrane-anchored ribosome-binding protein